MLKPFYIAIAQCNVMCARASSRARVVGLKTHTHSESAQDRILGIRGKYNMFSLYLSSLFHFRVFPPSFRGPTSTKAIIPCVASERKVITFCRCLLRACFEHTTHANLTLACNIFVGKTNARHSCSFARAYFMRTTIYTHTHTNTQTCTRRGAIFPQFREHTCSAARCCLPSTHQAHRQIHYVCIRAC